jgi:enoyl-CoA hydratase
MPETGIGLFPDVGGGWHLPRLPGQTGLWLALTGARIKAADCLALGIATHVVESAKLEEIKAALVGQPLAAVETLAAYAVDPGPPTMDRERIDAAFGGDSLEAIIEALRRDDSPWAKDQLAVLATKSPQTLKVAFRQLRAGSAMTSFADNMAMEYRIGSRVVRRHDFLEGVRAVIVDKDNAPRWDPASLDAAPDTLLDEIFAPLPEGEEWSPLNPEIDRPALRAV